jgi:hypothetical protein
MKKEEEEEKAEIENGKEIKKKAVLAQSQFLQYSAKHDLPNNDFFPMTSVRKAQGSYSS